MSTASKISSLVSTLSSELAASVTPHQFRTFCGTFTKGIDHLTRYTFLADEDTIYESHDSFVAFCTAAVWFEVLVQVKSAILADDDVDQRELALAYEIVRPAAECIAKADDSWGHFAPLLENEVGDFLDFSTSTSPRLIRKYYSDDNEGDYLDSIIVPVLFASTLATESLAITGLYKKVVTLAYKLIIQADGDVGEAEKRHYHVATRLAEAREGTCKAALEHLGSHFQQSLAASTGNREGLDGLDNQKKPDERTLDPETVLADATKELDELIGLKPVKVEITRLANYLKVEAKRRASGLAGAKQALHFVFTGNPGTGKTTVGRIMSKLLFGYGVLKTPTLIETDRGNLVGGYIGQTAIKTKEVIGAAIDGVLFVDEAYTLSGKGENDFGREAIDTILKAMEDNRDRLVIIAAGYTHNMSEFLESNPGLKSRFTRFIDFPDYSPKELCKIFLTMASQNQYTLDGDALANLGLLCHALFSQRDRNFGNGRVVRNLFEKTLGNHADRIVEADNLTREVLTTITADDLPYEMARLTGKTDLSSERWLAKCESCGAVHKASMKLIGNSVKCKCGHGFKAPCWTLVVDGKPFAKLVSDEFDEADMLVWE